MKFPVLLRTAVEIDPFTTEKLSLNDYSQVSTYALTYNNVKLKNWRPQWDQYSPMRTTRACYIMVIMMVLLNSGNKFMLLLSVNTRAKGKDLWRFWGGIFEWLSWRITRGVRQKWRKDIFSKRSASKPDHLTKSGPLGTNQSSSFHQDYFAVLWVCNISFQELFNHLACFN